MSLIRANEQYKITITDFEGPLDLLLHLIRDAKLDIKTVKLAEVTAQFLEFLAQLDSLNMELASEFIEVGATLIEIKARGILPRPADAVEDEEDIEMRLRSQLEEYKLLKEASEQLKTLENVDRFYKGPAEFKPEYVYKLDGLSMDALAQAFARIMHRIQASAATIKEKQIQMDRFTVKDKIRDIRTRIKQSDAIMFFDLFEADFTKSEMINTFLALLELLKNQEIKAIQQSKFADIKIVAGEGGNNGDEVTGITD